MVAATAIVEARELGWAPGSGEESVNGRIPDDEDISIFVMGID